MNRTPLELEISKYESMLVGFSGGVDSALLSVVARRVLGKDRTVAAVGTSPSLPTTQLAQARKLAGLFDLTLVEVGTHELDDPNYAANSTTRCYYCKSELWKQLVEVARELDMSVVAEGTNADDLGEHRPGLVAADEFEVVQPLADAGYSKDAVRSEARALGIPIWDAPAAPCLSSRLLYGIEVTPQRLSQVERSEALLRELGISGDLRVRHRGDEARIEVSETEFQKVRQAKRRIADGFGEIGFKSATLDLAGYRRGSLLADSHPQLEVLY